MPKVRRPVLERMEALIYKSGDCWLWTGTKTDQGYGIVRVADRRVAYAHRAMYELLVGPIPEGLQIDHLCRVRNCVNPDHLEPVTHRTNLDRAIAARTHCKRGHEFTPENTYNRRNHRGGISRVCKTCRNTWAQAHR